MKGFKMGQSIEAGKNRHKGFWKTCSWCNESKPATAEYFYRMGIAKGGFRPRCKICTKQLRISDKQAQLHHPKPTVLPEIREQLDTLHAEQALKNQMRIAAKEADYASIGIVIDGVKSDIRIKVCNACAEQYPATTDYFHRDKENKKWGLVARCKVCVAGAK